MLSAFHRDDVRLSKLGNTGKPSDTMLQHCDMQWYNMFTFIGKGWTLYISDTIRLKSYKTKHCEYKKQNLD